MLQELPEMWANTKKLAVVVKQKVAPLQVHAKFTSKFAYLKS